MSPSRVPLAWSSKCARILEWEPHPRAVAGGWQGQVETGQKTRAGARGGGDRSRWWLSTCMGARSPPTGVPGRGGPGLEASPMRCPRCGQPAQRACRLKSCRGRRCHLMGRVGGRWRWPCVFGGGCWWTMRRLPLCRGGGRSKEACEGRGPRCKADVPSRTDRDGHDWQAHIFNGKFHYKWPFSIATLNYQRVSCNKEFAINGNIWSVP